MLDIKKNRSKILAIATVVISCASLVLSVLALNNSRRGCPPEPFGCAQGAPQGKKDCMKRPHDGRSRDFSEKDSQGENGKRPEHPQMNEEPKGNDGPNKNERPNGNEKPRN
jgi:hypothetical protein